MRGQGVRGAPHQAHPPYAVQAVLPPGLGMMGSQGARSSWGSLHTEGGTDGEKGPHVSPHKPCASGPRCSQLRPHSPSSCQRRRSRDLRTEAAVSSPPAATTPPASPITPHPSRDTHRAATWLAHGPRTPGPLEETAVDPGVQARWHVPYHTLPDTPTLPHVALRATGVGREVTKHRFQASFKAQEAMAHWSSELSFPTQQ